MKALARRPDRVLPENKHVDCPCPPELERPILRNHVRINMRVAACLRCGAVSATESLIDEPRPFHVHCLGNKVRDVPEAAVGWLARWPRRVGWPWPWPGNEVYLSAALRCQDATALAAAEASAGEAQRDAGVAERLRREGVPEAAAPELPDWLHPFAEVHDALMLPPDASLEALTPHMERAHEGGRIAIELFARRPGHEAEVATLLSSRDGNVRLAAHAFICARRLLTPALTAALTDQIKAAAGTEYGLGVLLGTIYTLGPVAKPLAPVLRAKARWIWRNGSLRRRMLDIANGL